MRYNQQLNKLKHNFYTTLTPSRVLELIAHAANTAYQAGYHKRQEEIDNAIPRHQRLPLDTNATLYVKDQGYQE